MWFMKMKEPIPIISATAMRSSPLEKTCQMAFFMVLFPAVRRSFRFSRSARPLLLVRNALSAAGDLCLSSLQGHAQGAEGQGHKKAEGVLGHPSHR